MKLEEALKTLPIESIHTNTLVQLKANLEAKNIPFKYTIPPRRQVEQTLSIRITHAKANQFYPN